MEVQSIIPWGMYSITLGLFVQSHILSDLGKEHNYSSVLVQKLMNSLSQHEYIVKLNEFVLDFVEQS